MGRRFCRVCDRNRHRQRYDPAKEHERNVRRRTSTRLMRVSVPLRDRLMSKTVADPTGCWRWTGCLDAYGYGRIAMPSRGGERAYRVAYELLVGPIPDGLQLDHLCRNRACVNPRTSKR